MERRVSRCGDCGRALRPSGPRHVVRAGRGYERRMELCPACYRRYRTRVGVVERV